MPSIITAYGYKIYFWSNENEPLEPIHVHVSKSPQKDSTKVWLNKDGSCELINNNSKIPSKELNRIIRVIEDNYELVTSKWIDHFGEISFHDE